MLIVMALPTVIIKEKRPSNIAILLKANILVFTVGGRHGRDPMVVGFTTTCATSAYHH
jgi:hypothetical protein